jgi:hypothetical protein
VNLQTPQLGAALPVAILVETVALAVPDADSVMVDVVREALPMLAGPRFVPRKSQEASCAAHNVLGSCPVRDGLLLSDKDCNEEGND